MADSTPHATAFLHVISPVLVAHRQAGKCGGNTKNKMVASQPQPSQGILLSSPALGLGVWKQEEERQNSFILLMLPTCPPQKVNLLLSSGPSCEDWGALKEGDGSAKMAPSGKVFEGGSWPQLLWVL